MLIVFHAIGLSGNIFNAIEEQHSSIGDSTFFNVEVSQIHFGSLSSSKSVLSKPSPPTTSVISTITIVFKLYFKSS